MPLEVISSLHQELDLIKNIASQMADPIFVKELILNPNNINPDPISPMSYWNNLSIAGGYPGILALFTELDRLFPNEKWDGIAHNYILKIKEAIESEGLHSLSMFGGLAGVCFYIQQASRDRRRYRNLLSKLDAYFLSKIRTTYLDPFHNFLQSSSSLPNRYYETIEGLSGIGVYFLTNLTIPHFAELSKDIVILLIAMTNLRNVEGREVPGWHVPCESLFLAEDRANYPKGNFNLGLSHGISGVLAFLSMAMIQGIVEEGQQEAIEKIASWLMTKRGKASNRFFWPNCVSFEDEVSNHQEALVRSRDAWCYGTPGVARSLYLAGQALKDEDLKSDALLSFLSIFRSPEKEWGIPCPTFCHGLSGLLLITHLMAKDTQSHQLKAEVFKLKHRLLSYYSPSFPLGFKTLQPMRRSKEFAPIDRSDLLEGVSGILLTLLSLRSEQCYWHLPFLIDFPPSSTARMF